MFYYVGIYATKNDKLYCVVDNKKKILYFFTYDKLVEFECNNPINGFKKYNANWVLSAKDLDDLSIYTTIGQEKQTELIIKYPYKLRNLSDEIVTVIYYSEYTRINYECCLNDSSIDFNLNSCGDNFVSEVKGQDFIDGIAQDLKDLRRIAGIKSTGKLTTNLPFYTYFGGTNLDFSNIGLHDLKGFSLNILSIKAHKVTFFATNLKYLESLYKPFSTIEKLDIFDFSKCYNDIDKKRFFQNQEFYLQTDALDFCILVVPSRAYWLFNKLKADNHAIELDEVSSLEDVELLYTKLILLKKYGTYIVKIKVE